MTTKAYEIVFAFDSLLNYYPDSPEFERIFSAFMKMAFRFKSQNTNLPIGAMVAILKERKPKVITAMRNNNQNSLGIMLKMEMNPNEAQTIVNSLLYENASEFIKKEYRGW